MLSASTSIRLTGSPRREADLRGRAPLRTLPLGTLRWEEDLLKDLAGVTCVTTTGPGANVVSNSGKDINFASEWYSRGRAGWNICFSLDK